jgi:hypothetical protein
VTRQQRWIVAGLTMAIAVTRVYALSRSLWDWDEALFSTAVRAYDVTQHHPHPPGFPLFVLAAKFIHLFVADEFRSVQAVTLLGAAGLFPALFFLARELRFSFSVAACGAALYCFFPAVWIFGGTAFSDVPSTTLVVLACACLLRGAGDGRAYALGAILLAISAGFRSQNLLIGCAPALYATWSLWRAAARPPHSTILATIAAAALIVLGSYAGAAYASADPPHGYLATVANLRAYVRNVDSFMNPGREPLRKLFGDFFVHTIRSGRLDYAIDALAALGVIVNIRRFGTWMTLAMFVPFQLFAWLMLDPLSVSRYGTAYLPMVALLAAAGARVIKWADAVVIAAIVARLFVWTLPAVRTVRSTDAPTAAAMKEMIRGRRSFPADASPAPLFVRMSMSPFADYYLASTPNTVVLNENELPLEPRDAPYVCEGVRPGRVFARQRDVLWNIVRHRYFAVTLSTLGEIWRFGDGWHDDEGEGTEVFRWMRGRSVATLPNVGPRARLSLEFEIPRPLVAAAPTLTVTLNGRVLDRVRCTSEAMTKTWDVDTGARNELVLDIDRTIKPPGDVRELGLRLDRYSWTALP